MHMYSRQVQLTGAPQEVTAYATGMRKYVSAKSGQEIALWNIMFGAPLGSMAYTTVVDGLAGVAQLTAIFADDIEYSLRLGAHQHLVAAPAVDHLIQPLHGSIGEERPPVGSVGTVTSATIAPGEYEDAFGWGVDMAQYAESVTGTPVVFGVGAYGTFGQVAWISVSADPVAADAARDKLNVDPDYTKRLGDAEDFFVPGSGNQTVSMRIA